MKRTIRISLLLLLAMPMLFLGCSKNEEADNLKNVNSSTENQVKTDLIYCGTPITYDFTTYQGTTPMGTLTIGNDQSQLQVYYDLDPTLAAAGWYIYNARFFVGTADQLALIANQIDGQGSGTLYFPTVGAIPNSSNNSYPTAHKEYLTDLSTLPECYYVVAYMSIRNIDGIQAQRILWGKSMAKSWGYYIYYCEQDCETPSCETAYAYGEEMATCFLDIPNVTSNNWGWSNGPIGASDVTYEWPIYAGAGQCDTDNGTMVGTLYVDYDGSTATITYEMEAGFGLSETHLYVGNNILYTVKGKFTTAPGQFPYKHTNLNGATSDVFTIEGLTGDIYIAAHSVVCGDY